MTEFADDTRLAELNRNKEEYERSTAAQQRGEEDRSPQQNAREDDRREALASQREDERQRAAQEREQQRRETEASADRIAEGRRKYREEEASRRKDEARRRKDEETHERGQAARRERDVRRGYETDSSGKKTPVDYDTLSPTERGYVREETEQSASRLRKGKAEYVAKAKDEYYRKTGVKDQLKDMLGGNKTPYRAQTPKQVEPITTFFGGLKHQAGKSLKEGLTRPLAGIEAGRAKRAAANKSRGVIDPFTPLPGVTQRSQTPRRKVQQGTGMLFTEGFFNPPVRAASQRKGKRKSRKSSSLLASTDFNLGDMLL